MLDRLACVARVEVHDSWSRNREIRLLESLRRVVAAGTCLIAGSVVAVVMLRADRMYRGTESAEIPGPDAVLVADEHILDRGSVRMWMFRRPARISARYPAGASGRRRTMKPRYSS